MDGDESDFPPNKIRKLDEKITNPDEMVPVFPVKQLDCLLNASIDLYEKGADVQNEECQRFLQESLTIIFTKILTDNAISSWTPYAHDFINKHCEKLVKLCTCKLNDDSQPLLNLLALVLDPSNKFHTFNAAKQSTSVPPGSEIPDEKIYARPPADPENPRGWLVDLINKFGDLGGFSLLLTKFQSCRCYLTIPIIRALLRPFGLCQELLTVPTIDKYFLPIFEKVREILGNLTNEDLKKEAQNQLISHEISGVMKIMTSLASRVPQHKDIIANLELLRLNIVLRLLEIVENSKEVLRNFFFNLTSEELDYFFQGVHKGWTTGDTEERKKLLVFIHRLLEYDEDGAMMDKVLTAFWNVAHSDDVSTDVMDLALDTHLQFLNYSGVQDRDALKNLWLEKCIEEFKNNGNWTLPAIKQIRKIYNSLSQANRELGNLKDPLLIIRSILENLKNYIKKVRKFMETHPKIDETIFMPNRRYNHVMEVQERLDFFTFVLRNSTCVLTIYGVKRMWQCLGDQPVFPSDREACLKWFIELISAKSKVISATNYTNIFEHVIHQLDPKLLAETGLTFFEKFFEAANIQESNLSLENGTFYLINLNLIGKDYLWRVITDSREDIAHRGMELLMGVYKNLKSKQKIPTWKFHMNFVAECTSRLENHYDKLSDFTKTNYPNGEKDEERKEKVATEIVKIGRIKEVQKKYIQQCNIALPKIHTNNGSEEKTKSSDNTNQN